MSTDASRRDPRVDACIKKSAEFARPILRYLPEPITAIAGSLEFVAASRRSLRGWVSVSKLMNPFVGNSAPRDSALPPNGAATPSLAESGLRSSVQRDVPIGGERKPKAAG